ncbi:sulfite exporter TauE/SafE family protein [Epibacterium sp. MM17-32]|uniref:sulfite exporter TauE/SafE family protein n=1 Tax=Epibacterium sp. MM17-32 TaxID=2917734 RepID=UPI001EF5292F|nr:sulfite exporter TauE/SafE family protein [Epibacterium sp. MM17-32]MCG7629984.1 sulfite exporter TauE/SafE family protein [Epibacterium sp. MM17-32]
MLTTIALILTGLAAGALNAIAGGGTFLSFPALVWAGVPPIMANATATLSALPGYAGSAWAYRHDIGTGNGTSALARMVLIASLGGLIGAGLLLVTPGELFSGIVPWFLLLATLAFAFGPAYLRHQMRSGRHLSETAGHAVVFAVSIYGGYFNGGLGIMLLAAFGVIGMTDLHQMNGLKNLMSVILSLVSVATYTLAGLIDWSTAVILAPSCAAGGVLGAALARRVRNTALLRLFIIAVGIIMTLVFFVQSRS